MDSGWKLKVLAAVREIPRGQKRSYKEIAAIAGNPRAARSVGTILKANRDQTVPCHRVVRSDGTAGQYNGLLQKSKEDILREEGAL